MRVLIMVLSSYHSPYGELMNAQKQTWNSITIPGVETLFYSGGYPHDKVDMYGEPDSGSITMDMRFLIRDDYYFMAGKFKAALERSGYHLYDYIFRTNSSSYVHKQRLLEFAETLPKEKLYAGKTLIDLNDHSGLAVSGAGIWLSPDTAEILRNEIDPDFEMEEDVYIGRILRKHGITAHEDDSRIDFKEYEDGWFGMQQHLALASQPYHIRFKTSDRLRDANNMRKVHKLITG